MKIQIINFKGKPKNDIAQFSINNHMLQTYIKDSCSSGSNGNQVVMKFVKNAVPSFDKLGVIVPV